MAKKRHPSLGSPEMREIAEELAKEEGVAPEKVEKMMEREFKRQLEKHLESRPTERAAEVSPKSDRNSIEVPKVEHVCEYCGRSFGTKEALSSHRGKCPERPAAGGEVAEERLDELENLRRIVREVTPTKKMEAIIRKVSREGLDNLEAMAETLTLADIRPHEQKMILKNWAAHRHIEVPKELIRRTEEEEEKKEEEFEPIELLKRQKEMLKLKAELKMYKDMLGEEKREPQITYMPVLDEEGKPKVDEKGEPIMQPVRGAMDINTFMMLQLLRQPTQKPTDVVGITKEIMGVVKEAMPKPEGGAEIAELRKELTAEREARHKADIERLEKEVEKAKQRPSLAEEVAEAKELLKSVGVLKEEEKIPEGAPTHKLIKEAMTEVKGELSGLRSDVKEIVMEGGKPGFRPKVTRTPAERERATAELEEKAEKMEQLAEAEDRFVEEVKKRRR